VTGHRVDRQTTRFADRISLLSRVRERGFRHVPGFNDSRKTKKKDVLAVIDERISELEAGL